MDRAGHIFSADGEPSGGGFVWLPVTEMARQSIRAEVRRALVGEVPRRVRAGFDLVDTLRLAESMNAIS